MKLNLACGSTFVTGDGWTNLDFAPLAPEVVQADLLAPLPFADNSAELVYSSHFFEHVPRRSVPRLLDECFRVLAPSGTVRIVVPDLENICRTYLEERDAGRHDRADFLVLELIDQCVRKVSGGELCRFYAALETDLGARPEMVTYITERTGHALGQEGGAALSGQAPGLAERVGRKLRSLKMRLALRMLPPAFRAQNVSLAEIGETHQWMWDFHMLGEELARCGFDGIRRMDFRTSGIPDFPVEALDVDASDMPRKGMASMYVEAVKPGA